MTVRVLAQILRTDLYSVTGQTPAMITTEAKIDLVVVTRKDLIRRLDVCRDIPEGGKLMIETVSDLLEVIHVDGLNGGDLEQAKFMLDVRSIS